MACVNPDAMSEDTNGMETKRAKCDYLCETCGRAFHTAKGVERHEERHHA